MKNQTKNYLLFFLLGVIVVTIPMLIHLNTLEKRKTSQPFQFIPNAIAERKPIYLQMLKTPEQVKTVQQDTFIYKPSSADITVGSAVSLGGGGLAVYLKRELDLPDMHIQSIGPQTKERVIIRGYDYVPDAILTKEPTAVEVLTTPEQVRAAQHMAGLTYKDFLTLGAAIDCPPSIPCYVIGKSSMKDRIILHPFVFSKPPESKNSTDGKLATHK